MVIIHFLCRLSVEELDTLWQCLASDPECSDEFFSWLLRQVQLVEIDKFKIAFTIYAAKRFPLAAILNDSISGYL